ncbi:hypothetical protein M728_000781 [Ensifer sp. WSM1721]|uniref:hypothetical protein n=1 Tax=Ensifer sp. WSM1721 TaxID=1041159 RepID=UPI00047CBDB5|nr:hypothetical protein [Ensifer sp. WSM1721]
MAEVFTAGVQYNDLKGTAAADEADNTSIQTFFRGKGIPDNGFVVALRAYYLSSDPGKIGVRAVYADGDGFDSVNDQIQSTENLAFKELDIDLPLAEFFSLFKRFNVVLTSKGLGLDGREYTIQNA